MGTIVDLTAVGLSQQLADLAKPRDETTDCCDRETISYFSLLRVTRIQEKIELKLPDRGHERL